MEQPARRRHGQQRADFAPAAGLAEDRHVAGIAAEPVDVVAHPLQRRDHVERAGVPRLCELGTADRREVEEAEDVEPLIHGNDHDVVAFGQP